MFLEYIKSPVGVAKLLLVLHGIVVLGIGLHSHLNSAWYRDYSHLENSYFGISVKVQNLYEKCISMENVYCPTIRRERIFVEVSSICLAVSVVSFVLSGVTHLSSFNILGACYHILSVVALITAGCQYCMSALEIKQAVNKLNLVFVIHISPDVAPYTPSLLYEEKIVAGCFTILQGIFHICIIILVTWTAMQPDNKYRNRVSSA